MIGNENSEPKFTGWLRRLNLASASLPTERAPAPAKPRSALSPDGKTRYSLVWHVEREGNGSGAPVFMTAVNKLGHYHSWVEFGPDRVVYFRRTTPDWAATQTLFARWNGNEFTAPTPYEVAERWKTWRLDVRIVGGSPGPDGKVVFLDVATRNPKTGRGASDIWV